MIVVALLLAGCAAPDAGPQLPASYEEAKAWPGTTFEPEENSTVRLKVLAPAMDGAVATGKTPVVILLYDEATDTPIGDAEFVLDATMPAMGHGTSPEEDPTFHGHGVYVGLTTFTMPGAWEVELSPQLADGTVLHFVVPVDVLQGGHDDDHDHDDHEH